MSTFANKAIKYFLSLKTTMNFAPNIQILNPYEKKEVKRVVNIFFKKHFDDTNNRTFVLGINPGRFGGGLTGIAFTDPVALREECDIENNLGDKKELSSKFIYNMIVLNSSSALFILSQLSRMEKIIIIMMKSLYTDL